MRQTSPDKVVAELKFVFWQKLFTARHDERIWRQRIQLLFPGARTLGAAPLRQRIYDDLDVIRRLRNRIAHHEPIFTRDLAADLSQIVDLVELRSGAASSWLRAMEDVTALIEVRPLPERATGAAGG